MRKIIFSVVARDGVKIGTSFWVIIFLVKFLENCSPKSFFTSVKNSIACIEEEDNEMNMADFFHESLLI